MTRSISSALKTHFEGEVTTLATCWKLTRRDGTVKGFTDHVQDITFESVTYSATSGFAPSAVQAKDNFSVDNMDVQGILDSNEISEPDLQAGVYDFAELEIFMVNYEDLTQGDLFIKRGWLGEVKLERGQFVVEVRGLAQKLSQNIGRVYTPTCDAILGDSRCGVTLASFTTAFTVATVTSNGIFTTTVDPVTNTYFKGGKVIWTSGNNNGLEMEIKEFIDGTLQLALPMGKTIQVGDTLNAVAGCNKTRATCRGKFSNLVNFRGFPDLPGQDKIFETSSTRSETEET